MKTPAIRTKSKEEIKALILNLARVRTLHLTHRELKSMLNLLFS